MECVPQTYTKKVCTYKRVCKQVEYDTCKWVCTTECREKVCNVTRMVPVMKDVTKCVCKTITTTEKRIVKKTCYKNVEDVVNRQRLVELGHWECRERQPLFGGLFNGGDCCNTGCDPCNKGCCQRTVQHKVWVYCPKYECCPVKVCKKVCCTQDVEVCVPVCKRVQEQVTCKVCTYQCVQEAKTIKYSVPCMKRVNCKATKTVTECVPVESEVTCTRMVQRCVTREVPCTPCCDSCSPFSRCFGGLFRTNGGCCR